MPDDPEILPAEGTTPEAAVGAEAEQGTGTTPESEPAKGQDGLIFGKYATMEEAQRGLESLIELKDQLQRENQTYQHILEKGPAEPQGDPSPAPASSGLSANAKEEFVRLWNAGEHDKALDVYYGKRFQSLEKAIGETRLTAAQAQGMAELRRYKADPRFPRMREFLPEIEKIAQERITRNPGYGSSFKSKDEMMESLYAEAERKRGAAPSPGGGAARVTGIPAAGSRGRVPAAPRKASAAQDLDPNILKRYGIKPNPEQNRFHAPTLKLMAATEALEELEAQAS